MRSIPALLHEDNGGKRRHPGRTWIWIWTHVGHGRVVGAYEYTRHYPPATANQGRMRLLFSGCRACHESVSAMERSVSSAGPDAPNLSQHRARGPRPRASASRVPRGGAKRADPGPPRKGARRAKPPGRGAAGAPLRNSTHPADAPGCGTDGDMLCLAGFTPSRSRAHRLCPSSRPAPHRLPLPNPRLQLGGRRPFGPISYCFL